MAQHYIDVFSFQFWRSAPPLTVHYQSESFTRVGVDGIGKLRTGRRGKQFEATVEEDVISYAYAMGLIPLYHAIPGSGPIRVIYNSIDYAARFNHLYLVDAVEVMECKTHPRLVGPNYDFLGGARITVRWTMTPLYIDPETEEEST